MFHMEWTSWAILLLTTAVLADNYRHTSVYDLMKCSYGERGSLTATCVNATPNYFKSTPYRFDQLDETLICLNCTLTTIDTGTFDISGNQIKYLDLRRSSIESIKQRGFVGLIFLERLDLSNNKIRSIYPGTFSGIKKIKSLDLSENTINVLSADGFMELINLENLVLANNTIKTIDSRAFNGLVSLKTLDMSNNEIDDIKGVFENLTALQVLNLQNNRISELSSNELYNLTSLLEINLSKNKISTVKIILPPQNSLKLLNLASNYIEMLASEALKGLDKLETLDMSFNRIHEISKKSLLNMFNLHDFNLAYNNLTKLQTGTYSGLPQLRNLNCSHNSIDDIEFDGVFSISNLHALDLSYNNLTDLDYTSLISRLPKLSYIRLENNPLPCELEEEMQYIFSEDNFKFVLHENSLGAAICVEQAPRKHSLATAQKALVEDTSGVTTADIWSFILISIILVVIGILFYLQYNTYRELRYGGPHRATSTVQLMSAELENGGC